MVGFSKNKIALEMDAIGEELREARVARKLSLSEAARQLNISAKYLEALENSEPEKLPIGVYCKNFLREYADFLGLDTVRLLEIFENENSSKHKIDPAKLFAKRTSRSSHFLTIPRVMKNSLIIFAVLVCLVYLGYCLTNIISPPKLIVENPQANITTSNNSIVVRGSTVTEASVTINGQPVMLDADGNFSLKIDLKTGMNTVSVTAQKKYSRQSDVIRKILVQPAPS